METNGINKHKKSHLIFGWLFSFVLSPGITGTVMAQDYEPAAVRMAFDYFKQALLQQKGRDALGLVDAGTLVYYERLFEAARTLDSARLMRLPLYDKQFVLITRMHAIVKGTGGMKEKPFFIYATDSGLLNKTGIPLVNCNIGDVSFFKDSAIGKLRLDATSLPYYSVKFRYESGRWKVDVSSLVTAFSRMAGTGPSDPEYMQLVTAIAYNRPVDLAVWKPLVIQ